MEAKVVAESAANKAISQDKTHTLAYLQLCNALRSQEILSETRVITIGQKKKRER
jgi:hypothetical protein